MRLTGVLGVLAVTVVASGCYHATINTGRQPNGQTIDRPWAHSFIYGLVPPATVEAASTCPNGVARVETQMSFLNGLANAITFGIYSPMHITVHCAGGQPDDAVPEGADVVRAGEDGASQALTEAARRSARTGAPVWVELQ